ncbi:MAG: hypothetical protein AMXMBFR58_17520 [Phycisphaerae bacterium]|nr:hypothetical protein [Phycisphaerales bacterium]MCK6477342.1 hypothetical protein [Phycisphaerales bacterium]
MNPQLMHRGVRLMCAAASVCLMGSMASARPDDWDLGYGTDLDPTTDWAENIIKAFGEQSGWKVATTEDTDATKLFDDTKTRLKDYYTEATGKFKIDGKVLVSYVTGHGSPTDDGKDSWLGNSHSRIKMSEWATQMAASIPTCGVLIFTVDACATNKFWDEFIGAGGASEKNPFKGINVIVAMPKAEACEKSPVGKAMGKLLGTKHDAKSFAEQLAKEPDLNVWSSLDKDHEFYSVTVPAPGAYALAAVGVLLAIRRRRGA